MNSFTEKLDSVLGYIRALLIAKNNDYQSSFSDLNPLLDISAKDALLVRIGDKIKRFRYIHAGGGALCVESEKDTVNDLIGYLVLYRILDLLDLEESFSNVPESNAAENRA